MKRTAIVAILGACALGTTALAAVGITTLPTGWKIQGPEGAVATVGTLPTGVVVSRDGSQVFELESGHQKPALRVLDATTLKEIRSVPLSGAFGAPLRDPNGDGVWVSVAGTFQDAIAHVDTATGLVDKTVSLPIPFYPVAIARAPNGLIAVAGDLANRVAFVEPSLGIANATYDVGHHPAALVWTPNGRLYVADRGSNTVDVVGTRPNHIVVGSHPDALATDGKHVYVAVSDD
ncbi:MAG TPA: hypothetical protein VGN14_04980, partial [Candidatus Elarobacter sp.]